MDCQQDEVTDVEKLKLTFELHNSSDGTVAKGEQPKRSYEDIKVGNARYCELFK